MIAISAVGPTQLVVPLASLLRVTSPHALTEALRRVEKLDRTELVRRYQTAFGDGKRVIAYIMASQLIERGIPPCFWHEMLALETTTACQRADLMLADLAWMRRWYPGHASAVRYQRGRALLTGSDAAFHREADFAHHQGKRPARKIVGSLSMTTHQQWDATYLRSTPIKTHAELTASYSDRVRQRLLDDLRKTRRTATFGEAEVQATLARRHSLWRCSRMANAASPTEIAARFLQLTGTLITRQSTAKQLKKIRAVLRANGDDFMI